MALLLPTSTKCLSFSLVGSSCCSNNFLAAVTMSGGLRSSVKSQLNTKRLTLSGEINEVRKIDETITSNFTALQSAADSLDKKKAQEMSVASTFYGLSIRDECIPCLPMLSSSPKSIDSYGTMIRAENNPPQKDSSIHCSSSTVKQKIVMKVQFSSEKRRTEAFKIAAGFRGVSNVSVEADKDQVVVIGVGIDSVCLAKSLRKKLSYAQIRSVEEVKDEKKPEEKKPEVEVIPIQWTPSNVQYHPMHCDVVYW